MYHIGKDHFMKLLVHLYVCICIWVLDCDIKYSSQTKGLLWSPLCPLGMRVARQTASSVLQLSTPRVGPSVSLTLSGSYSHSHSYKLIATQPYVE